MNNLARKTASGAAINIAVTLIKNISSFVIVLPILARILPPEEFGFVGMAMAFVSFFTMFNDLGISAALVRADKPSPAFWSTAFWTNIGLGFFLTVITFLSAPAIADFFKEPIVEQLVQVLSVVLFFHCAFLVPMAWLQRNFHFKKIALINLTSTILSAAVAVWMALSGYGVWALVGQQIALFGTNTAGGLLLHRAPIRFVYKWSEIHEVLGFSLRLTGSGFIRFINRNTDSVLIGRVLGAESLGFYGRAYRMMMMPVGSISQGALYAIYPAMAAIKHKTEALSKLYLKVLSVLCAIILPMMTGLALVSVPFIDLMLGPDWAPVAPILVWLCFAGVIQSLIGVSNEMWKALGKSEVLLRWSLIRMVGFVSSFVVGIYVGSLEVLVIAYLIANIILYLPFQAGALKELGLSFAEYWTVLIPQIVSTLVMAAAILGTKYGLPSIDTMPSYLQLLILVSIGVLAYSASLLLLFRTFVFELVSEAKFLFLKPKKQPEST